MAENDGLTGAPVLVEDLCAVLRGDHRHNEVSQGSSSRMDDAKASQNNMRRPSDANDMAN